MYEVSARYYLLCGWIGQLITLFTQFVYGPGFQLQRSTIVFIHVFNCSVALKKSIVSQIVAMNAMMYQDW